MRAARSLALAGSALCGAWLLLGCSTILGLKEDVPSGPCTSDHDCAPDQMCVAGLCSSSAGAAGSGVSGAAGTGASAGSGSGAAGGSGASAGSSGAAGSGASAGSSGAAGSGASAGTGAPTSCGSTAIGDSAPCYALPDGTAISFPGGSPQGPCLAGSKVCQADGSFGPCLGAVPPGQTDCSTSADQNCDGKPDNSQCGMCTVSATQYCYDGPAGTQGVGTCQQGTQVCQLDASGTSAVWGACAGEIVPALSDGCDSGNDATCNQVPNEGCTCINGQSATCGQVLGLLGNCAAGTSKCVNGAWATCSVTPKVGDGCDTGDDASCNGKANESCACLNGQTQACGTSGTGCTLGTSTCQAGNFGGCAGNVCGDFAVAAPGAKCYVSGPNGEPVDNSCSIAVCPGGYHVSDCNAYPTAGSGSCSFDGRNSGDGTYADVTASKSVSGTSLTCALSSCTCRRDGF